MKFYKTSQDSINKGILNSIEGFKEFVGKKRKNINIYNQECTHYFPLHKNCKCILICNIKIDNRIKGFCLKEY